MRFLNKKDLTASLEYLDSLSLEDAKRLVRNLIKENKELSDFAFKAAFSVKQITTLVEVVDGVFVQNKENIKTGDLLEILFHFCTTQVHSCYWFSTVLETLSHYQFEEEVIGQLFSIVKDVCGSMCNYGSRLKSIGTYLLERKKHSDIRVKNLEERKGKKREKIRRNKFGNRQNLVNEQVKTRNASQKNGAKSDEERDKSTSDDRNKLNDDDNTCDDDVSKSNSDTEETFQYDGAKYGEEPGKSTLEYSASVSEKDSSEGIKSGCFANQQTGEKKGKTFKISCLNIGSSKTDRNMHQNITVKSNESSRNVLSDLPTSEIKEPLTSSSVAYERVYKMKNLLDAHESCTSDNDINEGKSNKSQNSVSVPRRSRKYGKRQYASIRRKDEKIAAKNKNNTFQNFPTSERSCKSEKYKDSNTDRSDLSDDSSTNCKKFKKAESAPSESETETEDILLREKPKKNRRGRKKRTNIMDQQEVDDIFKSSDKDTATVECSSSYCDPSSMNEIKKAQIVLTDVLDDPDAQHYPDIIEYKEKKKKENIDASYQEVDEMEETTFTKERNDMETLQTWNVLDAVSDDEDKEYDSVESTGELCSNDDKGEFDSDVDQEQALSDAEGKKIETDSDRELESSCSKKQLDPGKEVLDEESCGIEDEDNNENKSSDSEEKEHKKGPKTPSIVSPNSNFDVNSEDENDADAESTKYQDGNGSSRSLNRSPDPIYGKKGPRTPPSPAPFEPLRRGPCTPPGLGPDLEGRPFENLLPD